MLSCDQSLITVAFHEKLPQVQFYKNLPAWFTFNDPGLALSMALRFYSSVSKGFELKVINV